MFAEKLAQIAPGSLERTWPVSGGSEANETALKIARSYHKRRGETGRYKVISRRGSYHGMTGGVLWLGGAGTAVREDFEPAYPGMVHAPQPLPYRCEIGRRFPIGVRDPLRPGNRGPDTVPRPVDGRRRHRRAGVRGLRSCRVPADEYWPMLREICDRYGVLLIADEVICGFGRTGKMFAVEHWDVVPDIMTVAKGVISSYLPLAATIVSTRGRRRLRR